MDIKGRFTHNGPRHPGLKEMMNPAEGIPPERGQGAGRRPAVLVFDVNETLSDMSPLADRFADIDADPGLARTWFASLLRDGFALAVNGVNPSFATLAAEQLHQLLDSVDLNRDLDDAVAHVLAGFAELRCHPDVAVGLHALSALGLRLVTRRAALGEGLGYERAESAVEFAQRLPYRHHSSRCDVRTNAGACHPAGWPSTRPSGLEAAAQKPGKPIMTLACQDPADRTSGAYVSSSESSSSSGLMMKSS